MPHSLKHWLLTLAALCFVTSGHASSDAEHVVLETNKGPITIELYPEQAPQTVANFLDYVRSGFYGGTQFHRVIPGFMIQGGGFDRDLQRKPTNDAIPNESDSGLKNRQGSVAMARTSQPDSATSQFFINLVDNHHLNATPQRPGYAVFGQVIEGWPAVKAIASEPTTRKGGLSNVPVDPIIIEAASIRKPAEAPGDH